MFPLSIGHEKIIASIGANIKIRKQYDQYLQNNKTHHQ